MLYIVTYDIVNDRRRVRLAKALKNFGNRVQYSVFECLMGTKELEKLRKRTTALIDFEEDSVRIYSMCSECEGKIDIIGTGARTEDPDVYVL
jgi:CRISPR-associated protein Cas2